MRKLSSFALIQLVAELTADQISELKVAFDAFDTDHSGSIDAEELGKAMQSMGKHMNSKDLRDLINNVDEDGAVY